MMKETGLEYKTCCIGQVSLHPAKTGRDIRLAFFHRGDAPPWKLLPLPEIWSKNNSITIDICITIDFAPPLKKIPRRKPAKEIPSWWVEMREVNHNIPDFCSSLKYTYKNFPCVYTLMPDPPTMMSWDEGGKPQYSWYLQLSRIHL